MVHDSNQICKPRALESDWPEATTRCDMITSHILRTPDPRYFIKKQKASFSVLIQSSVTNVTPSTVMWHHDLPSGKERYLYIYISSCPVLNWMHTTVPSPMFFLLCIEMVWNKLNCSTSLEINILSKLRNISSLTNVQSIRQISTGDGAYTISDGRTRWILSTLEGMWRHWCDQLLYFEFWTNNASKFSKGRASYVILQVYSDIDIIITIYTKIQDLILGARNAQLAVCLQPVHGR